MEIVNIFPVTRLIIQTILIVCSVIVRYMPWVKIAVVILLALIKALKIAVTVVIPITKKITMGCWKNY